MGPRVAFSHDGFCFEGSLQGYLVEKGGLRVELGEENREEGGILQQVGNQIRNYSICEVFM